MSDHLRLGRISVVNMGDGSGNENDDENENEDENENDDENENEDENEILFFGRHTIQDKRFNGSHEGFNVKLVSAHLALHAIFVQ